MKKLRTTKGFTLLETMVVVGIVAILAVIGILEFTKYQKQLDQLELDSTAKEIFVAAQNHLSMAEGQGYLLREQFGTEETDEKGVYWFVASGNNTNTTNPNNPDNPASVLNLMLPFGSIEENIRTQGSYIIRYQKYPAAVLDVFYAQGSGRRGHSFSASEYDTLMSNYRGDEKKSARRSYSGSTIGYYGGVEAQDIETGAALKAPVLKVINTDTLYVQVSNPNFSNINASLNLIITGKQSGKSVTIPLVDTNGNPISGSGHYISSDTEGFTVTLDNITSASTGFKALFCTGDNELLPGEDIVLHAVAYSNKVYTNVAESARVGTNSLFANIFDIKDNSNNITGTGAGIASFRHLENLSPEISGLGSDLIDSAEQLGDLIWEANGAVFNSGSKIYTASGSSSDAGKLIPVNPVSGLEYDGGDFSIEDAVFSASGDAGVFGTLTGGSISNLELAGLSISSENGNAGALAGSASGTVFSGVLVHNDNSSDDKALQITGKLSTGGLAGSLDGGSVSMSAAAVYVKSSSGEAGGLIGGLTGTMVQGSYSGGHTVNARFTDVADNPPAGRINVQGKSTAGGLIGSASGSFSVSACYSTASCSAQTPGGLIGIANSGTVTNSYAAGRVLSTNGNPVGAFFGTHSSVSCSGKNFYLFSVSENVKVEIIPNVEGVSGKDTEKTEFILPDSAKLPAVTYDPALVTGYEGKFSFPTVSQLNSGFSKAGITNRHVGDWQIPSLEVMPFTVYNDDTLHLAITPDNKTSIITLAVTGQTSAHTQVFQLIYNSVNKSVTVSKQGYVGTNTNSIIWETELTSTLPVRYDNTSKKIEVVFDDITVSGSHFSEIFGKGTLKLEAGENIDIRLGGGSATWAELSQLTPDTTNSIFATNSSFTGARVAYVRHLQNLDPAISAVSQKVTGAMLTRSISWDGSLYPLICKNGSNTNSVNSGFYGICNPNLTEFAGNNYTLSGFVINSAPSEISSAGAGNAGLFRLVGNSMNVTKLMLKDFSVSATGNAAALAAEVTGGLTADTVLAASSSSVIIKSGSTGAAGGLVGEAKGTVELKNSAASMLISSSAQAGGLVGLESSGSLSIHECYAGGHTDGNKTFSKDSMNITGTVSGGIIGEAKAGSLYIANSFGAASVSGSGAGGGIIGRTSVSATLNLVYTVAPTAGIKVKEADASTASGAFIGQTASGATLNNTNCFYLPEIYPGATMINGASTVAYAGQGASLANPVAPANYEKDGSGNIISAKISGSTMQARTYPYDAKLKRDGNEFPFSIWTSFSFEFAGKKAGGTKTGIYYGDWQPVVISATVLHEITFKYADPLDSGTVKPVDDTNLGVQKIREGEDNSLLIPYIKNIVGYSITGWQIQGTSVVLHEENGFLAVPAEYITGDITIVAMYEKNDGYYTVSFYYDPTGANAPSKMELIGSTVQVEAGVAMNSIKTPSRNINGYAFDGWYADTSLSTDNLLDFNGNSTVQGDIHAYAKYISLEYYTITVDFMYRIDDGSTGIPSISKLYRFDSQRSQYKLQQLVGRDFNDYVIIPEFGVESENNVAVCKSVDGELTSVSKSEAELKSSNTRLQIKTGSESHYVVVFTVKPTEIKTYDYQIIYRFLHTGTDGRSYSDSGKYDLTYSKEGVSVFSAPENTVPDISLEDNIEGFALQTRKSDIKLKDGEIEGGKIYVVYERRQYTLSFDALSGNPVNPLSVYYGQPLIGWKNTSTTRAGYELDKLDGWKLYKKGNQSVTFTWNDTMPAYNIEAKANWKAADTTYKVMFWYENADDEGYSFISAVDDVGEETGKSVTSKEWDTWFKDTASQNQHTHRQTCYPGAGDEIKASTNSNCFGTTTTYKYDGNTVYLNDATSSNVKDGYVTGWSYAYPKSGSGKCIYAGGKWYNYTGETEVGGTANCTDKGGIYSWIDTAHFTYNSSRAETKTVQGDGSTVLNVYYSRNTYTLRFKAKSNSSTAIYTVTRKYNASIIDIFPIKSGNTTYYYTWNDYNKKVYQNSVISIDRMPGASVDFAEDEHYDNNKRIDYYTEVVTGSESGAIARSIGSETKYFKLYKTVYHNSSDSLTYNENFHAIEGFDRWGYVEGQSTGTVTAASDTKTSFTTKTVNEFYYSRSSFKIECYVDNKKDASIPVQYGGSLAAGGSYVPEYPAGYAEGYTFSGWFLDSGLSSPLDTSKTMPSSNLVVFGKWLPPTYNVYFYVAGEHAGNTANKLYGPFSVVREKTIDSQIADTQGNLKAEYTPDPDVLGKDGFVFDGWYYKENGEELQFIISQPIISEMHIYAKWTENSEEPVNQKRNVTVRYQDEDGNDLSDITEEKDLTIGTKLTLYAIDIEGYYPDATVKSYQVNADEDQEVIFVYLEVEPWYYDLEIYARYTSVPDSETAGLVYSFADSADYLVLAESNVEAINLYQTVTFEMPAGYENYHLLRYDYGDRTGSDTSLIINAYEGIDPTSNKVTVRFYMEPDPTRISIEDRYRLYDGQAAPSSEAGITLAPPAGATAETLVEYKYRDAAGTAVDNSAVVNAGMYQEDAYVILKVNGTAVGESASSEKVFLLWKNDESLNLRIGKRTVTLTSASAEQSYSDTPLTRSDSDTDITVGGDGFVKLVDEGGNVIYEEGVDISFSVDAFRLNAGTSTNAFTYEFKEKTNPDNYEITTVFGALSVYWNYRTDYYYTVSSQPGADTPDEDEYPLSPTISGPILFGTETKEDNNDSVEVTVAAPAGFNAFCYKEFIASGGTGEYNEETGLITLTPAPGAEKTVLKIYVGPDTDLISFTDLTAKEGDIPVFSTNVTNAAIVGYQADLYYVYRYFDSKDAELTGNMFYDDDGNVLPDAPVLEEGTYKVYAYAMLRMYEPVTDPNETPEYYWFVLKQQVDGKLKLTVK